MHSSTKKIILYYDRVWLTQLIVSTKKRD
jgi:hypothetical protein